MKPLPPLRILERMTSDDLGVLMLDHLDSLKNLRLLLEIGANVNVPDRRSSALDDVLYSISEQKVEIVELLLKHGSNPNHFDSSGHTPLSTAAYLNNTQIIKMLIQAGADPNLREQYDAGWAPLHHAAYEGNLEATEILLELGADPNTYTKHVQETPLALAQFERGRRGDARWIPIIEILQPLTTLVSVKRHPFIEGAYIH